MKKKAVSGLCKAAAAGTGVFAGVSYIVFREVMHRDARLPELMGNVFNKKDDAPPAPVEPDERDVWFQQQHFAEYIMTNDRGQQLKGYLLAADKPTDVYVFCSHGYRNHGKGEFNLITKFYHDRGFNVFLVDHQAAGDSEGKYITFGYNEHRDCLKWLNYMNERFGSDIQIILHGVSMGSATVMLMCGDEGLPPNVKFAVADCGYTSEWDEFVHNLNNIKIPVFPLLNGTDMVNRLISGFSFKDVSPIDAVSHAKLPMLFIHGKADDFVPTYMAGRLYEACSSAHKDLLLVDGAGHAQSYPTDTAAYEAKVNSFIDKYIALKAAKKASA